MTSVSGGSFGKMPWYRGSASSTNLSANSSNSAKSSAFRSRGQSIVALRIRAATGFRSFAMAWNPSLPASNGMLPPPAVGSSTRMSPESLPKWLWIQVASSRSGVWEKARL